MKNVPISSIYETDENIRIPDDIIFDYNGGYAPDADPADYVRFPRQPIKVVLCG